MARTPEPEPEPEPEAGGGERRGRRVWPWIVGLVLAWYLATRAPLPLIEPLWQAEGGERLHLRHRMADWMVLSRTWIGRTRAEVVARLGEPPPTGYFTEWSLVYRLGFERGFFPLDSEWLVLAVGPDGRVVEARVVRD